MKQNVTLVFFFFLTVVSGFSQQEKNINGRIVVKNATPSGVHIINLVNEKETISDEKGAFTILAKPDDLLVFSSTHLDYFRKIIEISDYSAGAISIKMTSKVTQLDEVEIVNYSNINAVDLGILSKPAKEYTPAERKLKVATDLNPQGNLGTMMGGSLSLDPLLNSISGRTTMLKKELQIEKRELCLAKLNSLYENEFYINELKIDKDYIKGFQYFSIENQKCVAALNAGDTKLVSFLLSELAVQYNSLLNDEKK